MTTTYRCACCGATKLALDDLDAQQLAALVVAGQQVQTSTRAAASDALHEGHEERAAHFDVRASRVELALAQVRGRLVTLTPAGEQRVQ